MFFLGRLHFFKESLRRSEREILNQKEQLLQRMRNANAVEEVKRVDLNRIRLHKQLEKSVQDVLAGVLIPMGWAGLTTDGIWAFLAQMDAL